MTRHPKASGCRRDLAVRLTDGRTVFTLTPCASLSPSLLLLCCCTRASHRHPIIPSCFLLLFNSLFPRHPAFSSPSLPPSSTACEPSLLLLLLVLFSSCFTFENLLSLSGQTTTSDKQSDHIHECTGEREDAEEEGKGFPCFLVRRVKRMGWGILFLRFKHTSDHSERHEQQSG